jgi:hypothetical protein
MRLDSGVVAPLIFAVIFLGFSIQDDHHPMDNKKTADGMSAAGDAWSVTIPVVRVLCPRPRHVHGVALRRMKMRDAAAAEFATRFALRVAMGVASGVAANVANIAAPGS